MPFLQLDLNLLDSKASQRPAIERLPLKDRVVDIHYRHNKRARKYLLYVRNDGSITLTIPRKGTLKNAYQFALEQRSWIERKLEKLQAQPVLPTEWKPGTPILLEGESTPIQAYPACPKNFIKLGPHQFPAPPGHANLRPFVEAFLQKLANRTLKHRVAQLASLHKLKVRTISIRNQSTRWGSCSPLGSISLNWRLIQMPHHVRDYIILHELMHLKEMNHSTRFWSLVAQVCPEYEACEHWIKLHSAQLGL